VKNAVPCARSTVEAQGTLDVNTSNGMLARPHSPVVAQPFTGGLCRSTLRRRRDAETSSCARMSSTKEYAMPST
jgi:hypothetical protein